jgi:hypothetical protein
VMRERVLKGPTKVALVIVFLKSKESALLFAMDMTKMANDTQASPFCCDHGTVVRRITRPCTLRMMCFLFVSQVHHPLLHRLGLGWGMGWGFGTFARRLAMPTRRETMLYQSAGFSSSLKGVWKGK